MKTKSHSKYQKWKNTVQDIEQNIDEATFYEFEIAYDRLVKDISNVSDGFGTTAHNLLMDYLAFIKGVRRDERLEEMQERRNSGIRN